MLIYVSEPQRTRFKLEVFKTSITAHLTLTIEQLSYTHTECQRQRQGQGYI